jgi:hypothetical protein
MTPPSLIEFACPSCNATHWEIDSEYPGADLVGERVLEYSEREYACPACRGRHTGWRIVQESPPEFLLQPHPMYPMTRQAFSYWARVLQENFPDHPLVSKIGGDFSPNHRVFRTQVSNLLLNRRYYLGRIGRRVRQWLGTGS